MFRTRPWWQFLLFQFCKASSCKVNGSWIRNPVMSCNFQSGFSFFEFLVQFFSFSNVFVRSKRSPGFRSNEVLFLFSLWRNLSLPSLSQTQNVTVKLKDLSPLAWHGSHTLYCVNYTYSLICCMRESRVGLSRTTWSQTTITAVVSSCMRETEYMMMRWSLFSLQSMLEETIIISVDLVRFLQFLDCNL